ncbi:MAG: PQQ-binding-like beta-propeller repeat protein [Minicystis sp.]
MPRSLLPPLLASLGLVAATALLAPGCGGGQTRGYTFDPDWRDDSGAAMAAFQKSFDDILIPLGADFAVGVTDKGLLLGTKLDGPTEPWTFRHDLDGRPALAGTVVVGLGGGELFALEGRTGKLLWKRNAGGALRGIGDDGATTVISLAQTAGTLSTVLAVSHSGQVIRQLEDAAPIGVPAVQGGYAFLPWRGHFVTVQELSTGNELARLRLPGATSRVVTVGGALFFGEDGLTRFDDRLRLTAKHEASTFHLPQRDLPGAPRWLDPGTDPLPLSATPLDTIRLYARPRARGPITFEDGRYFATYHRIAIGLESISGRLAWSHAHDADLLGGAAFPGGFALCDAAGRIDFLDAESGAVVARGALGREVVSCAVQIDGLRLAHKPRSQSLAEQLRTTLLLQGNDLAPMQKHLLKELLKIDDPLVEDTLRELATSDRVSSELSRAAQIARAGRAGTP